MMREVWVTMWSRLVLAKMLPRVLTRLPIVPQLLQPLEQGQHIGAWDRRTQSSRGDRPSTASDRKSFAKFWSYH